MKGGTSIACFNAINVVSRYPAGKQYENKRSGELLDFLVHVWQELGNSKYLQMDNESCFNGGYKHPLVRQFVWHFMWAPTAIFAFLSPQEQLPMSSASIRTTLVLSGKSHAGQLGRCTQAVQIVLPALVPQQSSLTLHLAEVSLEVHSQSVVLQTALRVLHSQETAHHRRTSSLHARRHQRTRELLLNKKWDVKLAEQDQSVWSTLFLRLKAFQAPHL